MENFTEVPMEPSLEALSVQLEEIEFDDQGAEHRVMSEAQSKVSELFDHISKQPEHESLASVASISGSATNAEQFVAWFLQEVDEDTRSDMLASFYRWLTVKNALAKPQEVKQVFDLVDRDPKLLDNLKAYLSIKTEGGSMFAESLLLKTAKAS